MTGTRDRDSLFRVLLDETLGGAPLTSPAFPAAPEAVGRPPACLFDVARPADPRRTVARFGDLASRYDRSGTAQ